ncbi:hypothetical protein EDC01DRAFT_440559 [Geopyxis carbonaria]|nr:hypothetical protein EDC01DRAFT_440559 [Geopyxis carbonaria]
MTCPLRPYRRPVALVFLLLAFIASAVTSGVFLGLATLSPKAAIGHIINTTISSMGAVAVCLFLGKGCAWWITIRSTSASLLARSERKYDLEMGMVREMRGEDWDEPAAAATTTAATTTDAATNAAADEEENDKEKEAGIESSGEEPRPHNIHDSIK